MSRHDSRRQRFLLQGPIEEVGSDAATREAVRERDDDPTRELLDELEQILSSGQAALPSPDAFDEPDDGDEPPFAPRDVVAEGYDPYQGSYDDEYYDDEYYDDELDDDDDGIEAVDYWIPAAPYGGREPPRLPPPREPEISGTFRRRLALGAGIVAIFLTAAAGTYLVFQMTNRSGDPQPVDVVNEPVVAEATPDPTRVDVAPAAPVFEPELPAPNPEPVIVDLEPVVPRVIAEPANAGAADPAAADEGALPGDLEPAPLFAPAAEAAGGDDPEPAPAEPVGALAEPQAAEPVLSEAPVSETGVTTAWVNLRTGPSNAYQVVSVVAEGADVGIVACERWCEIEVNGERGWIHGDFIQTRNAAEAVAALIEETAAITPGPFTANAAGALGIYDSPYEDGEVVVTIRNNGDIFVVGCDANWCEVRFGADNRRGWVDRRQVRMPDDVTDAVIPPLPPITREQAAALKAAAAGP